MNTFRLTLLAVACAGAGACSSDYYERSDKIRFGAGDAVATNILMQTNPYPPRSSDRNIPMDAVKAQKAIERYRAGNQDGEQQGGGMLIPTVPSNGNQYTPAPSGN